jgi:hypothetical protein
VRYVVINSRDLKYLVEAGIPETQVFLLNNPVPAEELPGGDRDARKEKFTKELFSKNPGFTPGAPVVLYPIRTIRRKNVLEMGLICASFEEDINLIVTLAGTSQLEVGYSASVEKAFSDGLIPGIFGIGSVLQKTDVSFHDLVSVADVICSSSVQEGFGYLFVNSVNWRIPLFARYLDVLDGISTIFENHPSYFYRSFMIPVTDDDIRSIRTSYEEKTRRLKELTGEDDVTLILEQFSDVADNESVDFSYLPVETQINLLEKAGHDPAFVGAIRGKNPDLFSALRELCGAHSRGRSNGTEGVGSTDWPFTFETYAKTVERIIASFASPPARPRSKERDIRANLIRRFASIDYLRLLYGN